MADKGLLGGLFDLSFSEFITTRVIKVLFILGVVCAALATLTVIAGAFTGVSGGAVKGLVFLVFSPIFFLIYVLLIRIWCELIIVVFRIAENTGRIVELRESEQT